jgi:long-chain acyl-CoA synthetase
VVKLKTILLTGANGFIATHIARNILSDEKATILALVRADNKQTAQNKLAREWWEYPELINALGTSIKAIGGDVCQPKLGLDKTEYTKVVKKTTHIIHTAADWRFLPLDELRKTNVQGTANIIALAKEANKHRLERLSHISTAYVAGAATGTITENQLTDQYGFFTDYEHSKYEGEQLVQAAKDELPITVFRPSMVVGDSNTGAIKTFNTFYFPLRLYLTGKMRVMPVSSSLKINVVPVDYAAKTIVQLTFEPKAKGQTFHVVAPYESLPKLGELLEFVQKWAKTELSSKIPKPIFLPMSASSMKTTLKLQRTLTGNRRVSDALISLSPYFSENRQFKRDNLNNILGPYDFKWQEIMPKLLQYAIYNSFFHRSDRTVHEQVLFRLNSKSNPINYFDVIEGKTIKKTAQQMHQDILAITSSLKAYGITVGDRVALTGLNSTRYFALDIAIGLAGAVSVPLYYTTPPSDINDVLKASGAKLLFIGMPSLIERIKEINTDMPLISLCKTSASADAQPRLTSWEEFLSKAKDTTNPQKAQISFGDIATLRYSSGTTGKPKGAIFTHANLRYMAESIVSITSWQARNRKCRYLSFLPMGHVVEGILATYSPYYIPAPIEIYFLEDFRRLQQELPKVRPTVFFSVPRIYEKVWEALEKNSFGRLYIKTKSTLIKKAMRRTLRNMTLKRAGLNKCTQLIAGSARSNEDLLQNYRKLGIEIHNAYGLTEAPLVTINRLGRNRIGTVGEPMPFTQVKIAEDGEIMAKGPQVTAGYFDKSLEAPIKDGWLMTGDIGEISDEGSLIIFGRKKELIKTSYGKCIYSGKIEGMLRDLPEVTEAMLVGESKPYCTALAWVDKKHYNQTTLNSIDKAMEEMNKLLSNPEKIKKWAILPNNLSIENGELTPNLKLKRNFISQKYTKVVESLYTGVPLEGEIHMGGTGKTGE